MIPVRLTLRNFMSYGDERTTLDFTGMHVACLSGDNGNGKSALLDAMTYALWGKTRASGSQASSEDDLVRLGAEDMEVTFEFRLGDDLYRTQRKRNARTRSGEWQLNLADATGTWRPVGATGMRETEKQLIRLLRMEYETFLNSAYIQQGHADEFTRQKPDTRKRILADILDLSRYDRLEEMAKEARNECDLALKDLEGEIRHLEARAAEEPAYQEKLTEHESSLTAWTSERELREEKLKAIREQLAALEVRAQTLREREEKLREAEQEVDELRGQIERLRVKAVQEETLLADKPAICADYARLGEVRALLRELEPGIQALHESRRGLAAAQGRLEAARQKLIGDLHHAEAEWRHVEERQQRIAELDARLADVEEKLAFFEDAKQKQEYVRAALARAQERFSDLAAQSKKLKTEIAEVEEVLSLLAEPKPACPVCQTDLTGGKQQTVILRQKQKLAAFKDQLAEVNREGAKQKQERDELQRQSDSLEAQLRGEAALNAQKIEWERSRQEALARNARAPELDAQLHDLRRRIAEDTFGAEERAEVARLEKEIARLERAAQQHNQAAVEERELVARQAERRFAQLEEAERSHAQSVQEIARLEERMVQRCEKIGVARKQIESMRAQLGDFESVRTSGVAAESALREAAAACEELRAQVERYRHLLEDCARAREQAGKKTAERDKVAKDRQAYVELAAAFGKKGVQALIIDNALPEIQDEANRLLARMTDNAMQIALSTLRPARAGGQQIETLDIQITDDAGTRPYEMFSGGEAFRINFAIRIALSRLLARRAGARLQTLILDEGFGTQDAKGRERLVEAIEAVKEEFSLILVISHIEELKDAFPTRIEVTKTAAGSQINLLE